MKGHLITRSGRPGVALLSLILIAVTIIALVPGPRAVAQQSSGVVGVVGCSNTREAVNGYLQQSGADVLVNTAKGGFAIADWAGSDQPWSSYDRARPEQGYSGVWVNLCERIGTGLSASNVQAVLDKIWARDPGVQVWMSPLNFYVEETCDVTGGNEIPNAGASMANDFASSSPDVSRGPDLGPVPLEHLQADQCHLLPSGEQLVGSQLVDFFDSLSFPTTTSTTTATSSTTTTEPSTSTTDLPTSTTVEATTTTEETTTTTSSTTSSTLRRDGAAGGGSDTTLSQPADRSEALEERAERPGTSQTETGTPLDGLTLMMAFAAAVLTAVAAWSFWRARRGGPGAPADESP